MASIRRSKKQLDLRRIRHFKVLARRIDVEESASIRARGQAVFARHDRLRSIVKTLKARRLHRGMTLAALARATGIAKPNLSRLENNTRATPTLDTLERYARALGMTIHVELASADAA
jgi:DNA-binding Xre family transcriptional regulator